MIERTGWSDRLSDKLYDTWFDTRTRSKLLFRAAIGSIAAGAFYAACMAGEDGDFMDRMMFSDSKIVSGVHGQIENMGIDELGPDYADTIYWVSIEQCSADVEAAKKGNSEQRSFNPEVGKIGKDCYADGVQVAQGTYQTLSIGEIVRFNGRPTEHLPG